MTSKNTLSTRLLILGSSGLLGSTLVQKLKGHDFQVYQASRFSEWADIRFDPTNYLALCLALERVRPNYVINLVGLTSVDECESNIDFARNANVTPNLNLVAARSALALDFSVLSISTDHVYDSPGDSPEGDITLRNVYALTKIQSELALDGSRDLVFRTNFVGKSLTPGRESLTDWLWKRAKLDVVSSVIEDVYFSPLSISTVSDAIAHALNDFHPGVFNLGSHSGMSKAEFDFCFLKHLGFETSSFVPVKKEEASFLVAPRPSDMRMDSSLFETTFKLPLPDLRDEIPRIAQEYKQ